MHPNRFPPEVRELILLGSKANEREPLEASTISQGLMGMGQHTSVDRWDISKMSASHSVKTLVFNLDNDDDMYSKGVSPDNDDDIDWKVTPSNDDEDTYSKGV